MPKPHRMIAQCPAPPGKMKAPPIPELVPNTPRTIVDPGENNQGKMKPAQSFSKGLW